MVTAFAVEMLGIQKRFGDVVANHDVNLRIQSGTIHALIGENGAGKSTAMKILFGLQPADAGEIRINGKKVNYKSPRQAMRDGLGMVHQHFMLAEPFSAFDNVIIGDEPVVAWSKWLPRAFGWQDRETAKKKIYRILRTEGQDPDLEEVLMDPIEDLPVGQQQRIEILKLLYRDAKTLILDEPTAVLTPQEIRDLFQYLRKLKAMGRTIVIITHKLKEVMELADRVSVLRGGAVVGEREVSKTTEAELAELMVGRAVDLGGPELVKTGDGPDRPVRLIAPEFGISVHAGEIVGVAGIEGNGQTELVQDVVNARPRAGLAYIPADRHREALCLEMTVEENLLLAHEGGAGSAHGHVPFSKNGILQPSVYRPVFQKVLTDNDVRPADLQQRAGALSGGNQQKLVIAREFLRASDALVACHPTRGVDIGAIEFIHQQIANARARGVGVLLVSSELDEVLALSDRVHVLFEGQVIRTFERPANGKPYPRDEIGLAMAGLGAFAHD